MIEHLLVFITLFILIHIYFKIADKYNIIDKPNHRSAHSQITLRGGGIIFPIAFMIFCLFNCKETIQVYWPFGLGLLAICLVSFIDDIKTLSGKVRISVHFISVCLLLYFTKTFNLLPFWTWPMFFIMIIGTLNAYNFMDGINGMTGAYTLVTLLTLLYINQDIIAFTADDFITYAILASLVFLFFNFRKKAKCFAGDVGSMGIGFWVIGLVTLLIMKTQDYKYILLFSVYGMEVVLTIIERLSLKENIFEAHRRHLYQLLANEKKLSHLTISSIYAISQLVINVFLLHTKLPIGIVILIIFIPFGAIYLGMKISLKRKMKSVIK
ncbi:UDP-N-acetylmuramyl pentapeptide phosphotransferase/UDP-N-acetylglucosamine-1-phosphate transferase [Chryseobacterium taichungense]|uniref:UDP-N-acetylmuramyl pentapeptide phosphotransferase/UDP-N-acetylglucosamine-1-phosphate transferase n=1 Tax=Chryseobacterium taichungense TaxID=295069 RepID=A0A1H7VTI0_9FLAO|nr:glycosyltransferase family 4 protein [Chryseobacterium taichungense]SEM12107.1 UDP-N-acetylmuramyl pentapeptide phosphotransferase/UDP-N-acetylglucosamine-1-phosphate transferase [Chryseobacterium taichungense]